MEDPSASAALNWISGRSNWLIVFDNADGGYQVVEKFLPPGKSGSILITSRDKGLERVSLDENSLEVQEMGEKEAVSLLLQSAMIGSSTAKSVDLAQKLVKAVGYVPIAIDQAGAFVHSCACSLGDYLEMLQQEYTQLMSIPEFKGASDYGYSTYGTWEISMKEIERRATNNSGWQGMAAQSALKLFKIFAFFHHQGIHEDIFRNAAQNYWKRKDEQNDLPCSISVLDAENLFLTAAGGWNMLQFQAGIQVLVSFSLVKSYNKQYSVHPLVHTWSRDRIPRPDMIRSCSYARALLSCSIEADYEVDNYGYCGLLVPHIKMNHKIAKKLKADDVYYDDESTRFGFVFGRVGSWEEAEKQYMKSTVRRRERLGGDHPSTFTSMANLACTYSNQGKWEDAEKLELHVMGARKAKLGADHPDTLTSMANLACTYSNQGMWEDAEKLKLHVMEASKAKLGADHPSTLTSMANLASTYRDQGRWEDAETLALQMMELKEGQKV